MTYDKQLKLKMNLSFFDAGEKTEQATPKKRRESRAEGNVAKSQEASTAFLILTVFFALQNFAPRMLDGMLAVFQYGLTSIVSFDDVLAPDYAGNLIAFMFWQSLSIAMPILIISLASGVAVSLAQVGWHPTSKTLKPKLSRLNPISGFKRIFSFQSVLTLVKSIAKLVIIIAVIYNAVKNDIDNIPGLLTISLIESVSYIGDLVVRVGLNVGLFFIFIAIADYAYTRYKHNKDIKMSKHEVKEEYKQAEGNPEIKGKIKRKMREVSMRRMMKSVPQADVIITNPTHYAVALEYEKVNRGAPVVTAKGVDFLARRIREVAKENKVEIVENVQLARSLYASVEIGHEIPQELFQAVAEVLAYVYKLKNKTG